MDCLFAALLRWHKQPKPTSILFYQKWFSLGFSLTHTLAHACLHVNTSTHTHTHTHTDRNFPVKGQLFSYAGSQVSYYEGSQRWSTFISVRAERLHSEVWSRPVIFLYLSDYLWGTFQSWKVQNLLPCFCFIYCICSQPFDDWRVGMCDKCVHEPFVLI